MGKYPGEVIDTFKRRFMGLIRSVFLGWSSDMTRRFDEVGYWGMRNQWSNVETHESARELSTAEFHDGTIKLARAHWSAGWASRATAGADVLDDRSWPSKSSKRWAELFAL